MKHLKSICIAAALLTGFSASAQENVKVSGFLQSGYTIDDNDANNNTFYIKRARMSLSGNLFNESPKKVDYKLQVDFAGTPKLIDLWVKYAFNEHIGIQFGQAKTPLAFENSEYAPVKLEFIDYSLVTRNLAMANGCTGRDLGVQVYGKFFSQGDYSLLTYQAGFFNGNGINKSDDNNGKNLIGRVMINPVKELTFSGYFLSRLGNHQRYGDLGTPYGADHFSRTGFGANYDSKKIYARTEYIWGYNGGYKQSGAYAQAGYKVSSDLNFGVRYDYYTDDVDSSAKKDIITVAASYYPVKNLRLQLNYTIQTSTNAAGDKTTANGLNFLTTIIY